jgi:hypothetical protein
MARASVDASMTLRAGMEGERVGKNVRGQGRGRLHEAGEGLAVGKGLEGSK